MVRFSWLRSTVFRRTASVVLLLSGVAVAIIAAIGWSANRIMTASSEAAIAADIAALRGEHAARGEAGLEHVVAERSRVAGPALFLLLDPAGERRSGNLGAMPAWVDGSRRGVFRYQGLHDGATRTGAGVRIDIDGRHQLVVGRDIEDQRAILTEIQRSIAIGAALLLLLGLAGSVAISRHALARIDGLGAASAAIMSGDLTRRLPLDGSGDELDRLALQLNAMLARIDQLMASLREVSDNIAHDLKTPLNRLRNRAEEALKANGGAEAWHAGLERVIDEADEIIKTFNALLLIARLEAGAAPESIAPVSFSELVVDLAELYEPLAEEAGFSLSRSVETGLEVKGNRQLLSQAVANLVENALKYGAGSGTGGSVSLTLSRSRTRARLEIADRGSGIPGHQRQRVLDRFVRLEQSRSKPGTGLGLSLVAAVVRLHAGTMVLEDNAPGLRVVIELPLANVHAGVPSSPPAGG